MSKNTHILFFITQGGRSADGGVTSIMNVVQRLNLNVRVVTTQESPVIRRLKKKGVDVTIYRYTRYLEERGIAKIKSLIQSNVCAYRLVSSLEPSIIHTNDRAAFRACGIGARLSGVPIVDNVRDTQPRLSGMRQMKWLIELVLANRALTLSKDMCNRWRKSLRLASLPDPLESYLSQKFDYIYSIVDRDRFRPPKGIAIGEIRQELGVDGSPLLVYVASFHPKKKQRSFIKDSLPRIFVNNPSAQVAFVGDFDPEENTHAAECRRAVEKLGLTERVCFTGYRNDVERWYQAADITILASEKEGLARSMIESIACGTPVISFDVASAREILEAHECGLVVPQGDYNRLSQAVSTLWVDERLRKKMGENGASTARKLFEPDRIIEDYEALYKKVAQEG